MIVVSDASPLIALSGLGRLELLRDLYGDVMVPEEVFREVADDPLFRPGSAELRASDWIIVRTIQRDDMARTLAGIMDKGEAEAVALALQAKADLLLIDERRARFAAERLGLKVVGVLGSWARQSGAALFRRPRLCFTTL